MNKIFRYIFFATILALSVVPVLNADNHDRYHSTKYCIVGGSEGIHIDEISTNVVMVAKITSDNLVSISLSKCPGTNCNGESLAKGVEYECKDFFGNICDVHQVFDGYMMRDKAGGKVYLDDETLSYFGTDKPCPSVKVDKEFRSIYENFNVVLKFADPNTDGYINSANENPVEESAIKKTLEDIQNTVDPFNGNGLSSKLGKCTDYLGSASDSNTTARLLDNIFDVAKIIAIIIAIGLAMLDFVTTVTKDKEKLNEVVQKNVKRIIVLIIILLLPTIIDIIGSIFGLEDILCGIK